MENSFFPFEEIRKGQEKFIFAVEEAIKDNNNILVHAPTGIGKTAASIAPALEYALRNKKKLFFLTTRNTHHKIALDTLKKIRKKNNLDKLIVVDLVGKKHMCKLDSIALFGGDFGTYCTLMKKAGRCGFFKRTYTHFHTLTEEAERIKGKVCGNIYSSEEVKDLSEMVCPYEIQTNTARGADVIIGDYFHLFNKRIFDAVFSKSELELKDIILIADEAHNLANRVKSIYSTTVSAKKIKKTAEICASLKDNYLANAFNQMHSMILLETERIARQRQKSDEFPVDIDFLLQIIEDCIDCPIEDFLVLVEKLGDVEVQEDENSQYLFNFAENIRKWQIRAEGFLHYCVLERGGGGQFNAKCKKECLDPGILTRDIFSRLHSSVLMSATLAPFDMQISILGLDRQKTACLELPSPFPKENRKIIIADKVSSKYDKRSADMYRLTAEYILGAVKATNGNIAVFFPSYEFMSNVLFYVEEDGFCLLVEQRNMTKKQKENLYNQFKKCSYIPPFGLLAGVIGASFSEGVDFPGKIVKTVCIVGIPFERTNINTTATIDYYDKRFSKGWDFGYIYPAINKTIQAAGRCIRSEKDIGAIILLDERYLMSKYRNLLPSQWSDAVTVSSRKEMEKELDGFFDK